MLYDFKHRNSFKRCRLFGEPGGIDFAAIISELYKLRKKYHCNQSMVYLMPTYLDYSTN